MSDIPQGSRFNISRWALEHAPLTRYLMVVLMVLGLAAYFQLGQDEDPPSRSARWWYRFSGRGRRPNRSPSR